MIEVYHRGEMRVDLARRVTETEGRRLVAEIAPLAGLSFGRAGRSARLTYVHGRRQDGVSVGTDQGRLFLKIRGCYGFRIAVLRYLRDTGSL